MAELFADKSERLPMSEVERIEYRILLGEAFVDDPDLRADAIVAFTDGSASVKTRLGGWGAVLLYDTWKMELWGGFDDTTNNEMELTAILRAINAVAPGKLPIRLFSDSRYCVDALTEWVYGWMRRGWITGSGTPVANADLIEVLHNHPNRSRTALRWVRGHDDVMFNEEADRLAGRYKTREIA